MPDVRSFLALQERQDLVRSSRARGLPSVGARVPFKLDIFLLSTSRVLFLARESWKATAAGYPIKPNLT